MRTSLALSLLAAVAVAVALAPAAAGAHGVEAEVDEREGAVAARVRYHGGRPLAGARYEVRSPRGGEAPFAQGTTDRHGWLAFTPDVAGTWKIRVVDAGGHGKAIDVEVRDVPGVAASAGPPHPGPLPSQGAESGGTSAQGTGRGEAALELKVQPAVAPDAGEGGGSALRILAGVTAILVVFRVLLAVQRARRRKAG